MLRLPSLLAALLLGTLSATGATPAPATHLPDTLVPEPHQRDPYDWQARHKAVKEYNAAHRPEYVVIGDSITHHWGGEPSLGSRKRGQQSWEELFGRHAVTNMGFGFDYTDNAYYRIADGELAGASPRVIILLLGTNNIGHRRDTPKACADNLKALVSLLRKKAPASKILILGILPRREAKLAEPIAAANKLYRQLADNKKVFFLDLSKALAQPGSPANAPVANPALLSDVVHPNAQGYEAIVPELKKALKRIDSRF